MSALRQAHPRPRPALPACVAAASLAATGCAQGFQSVVNPKSDQASSVALLWWVMLAVGTIVLLGTTLLLAAAVLRHKHGAPPSEGLSPARKRNLVLAGGVVAPVVVVFGLVVYSVVVGREVAAVPRTADVTIAVVGHQWWWDVTYSLPGREGVARTANEIHMPVGVPVRFVLESRDVIHSFWMPNLQGKTDLIPGRTNYTWVTAREPGVFRGQCAEFCGLQHAKMAFVVVVSPRAEFDEWLARQARPAEEPEDPLARRGRDLFVSRQCVLCHAVRGTQALASVGPDLTHFGSRRSVAAGTLPNTRGHLSGWLADPQNVKPGNRMPNLKLAPEELSAIVAYLESLE